MGRSALPFQVLETEYLHNLDLVLHMEYLEDRGVRRLTEVCVVEEGQRVGMSYRSRRITEYCVVLQKQPRKAKGVWKIHNVPDTWREIVYNSPKIHGHPDKGEQFAGGSGLCKNGDQRLQRE